MKKHSWKRTSQYPGFILPEVLFKAYLLRVCRGLEPIPADPGVRVEYTLDRSPLSHRANISALFPLRSFLVKFKRQELYRNVPLVSWPLSPLQSRARIGPAALIRRHNCFLFEFFVSSNSLLLMLLLCWVLKCKIWCVLLASHLALSISNQHRVKLKPQTEVFQGCSKYLPRGRDSFGTHKSYSRWSLLNTE